ncbi:cytidine deaminase [Enterobacter cancerogenus]|uniref:Cytidine deaminase n=1 Tax=Enterobacter cancerogenus TaxID=69218 RepID=A0A484YGM8_9ENTR|nr:cytidine deaminase [Enterobacter cancerogenus]
MNRIRWAITLPDAFGPKDLEIKTLLMDAQNHGFALSGDELSEAAIAAANMSHTPLQHIAKRRGASVS